MHLCQCSSVCICDFYDGFRYKTKVLKYCKGIIISLSLLEKGEVSQDMRNAKIFTQFKNKGNRSDCNNYHGISLLCIIAKLFAQGALKRPQGLAESLLRMNCNLLSKLTCQLLIWCSPSNSCGRNAGNNGNHSL